MVRPPPNHFIQLRKSGVGAASLKACHKILCAFLYTLKGREKSINTASMLIQGETFSSWLPFLY